MVWKVLGLCISHLPYSAFLLCCIYPLRSVQEPNATVYMYISLLYKIPAGGHSDTDQTLPFLRSFLLRESFPSILKEFIVTFRLKSISCFHLLVQTILAFPQVHYMSRWPSCYFRWVISVRC